MSLIALMAAIVLATPGCGGGGGGGSSDTLSGTATTSPTGDGDGSSDTLPGTPTTSPTADGDPVIVTASVPNGAPGAMLQATGSYVIQDGSTFISSNWSQTIDEGVPATISDPTINNPTVTLGSASDYAAYLIQVLKEPPITEADLPPNLKLQPINEIEKGLQDRNQVVAINPLAHERAEEVPLTYSVTTTSGTYKASVNVSTELPWVVNTGLRTVPVGLPVLLYAKCEQVFNPDTEELECPAGTTFQWQIVASPRGSTATLTDANTQTPWFTPDMVTNATTYQIEETISGAILEVHVGRYHGVIDPVLTLNDLLDGEGHADGRPEPDPRCMSCHDGSAAPDNFTPWRQTGHAEAFTQGITTNGHFGTSCFACHSVGYQSGAGGIDDTPNYTDFLADLADAQHANPPTIAGLWESMLAQQPDTARLSNIQCENCHGPQDYTQAHRDQPGAPRVSLAADVCGSCHGEPARHGRFQQWQLSNHADYDLARERGAENGNCARCHSGNGFVAWSNLDFDPDEQVDVTWDEDTVVPQVCAACHNPHDTGTTSGSDETNAKVRVMGNTHKLIAGFTAIGVGKGATCMTCHNSRAGKLRNDNTWDTLTVSEKTGTPHHGVQADLIMGQNVYFVQPGIRGKHSFITDVCVTCHMNKTQPPDILSYNQSGTNHTFAADPNICSDCHGEGGITAENVQTVVGAYLDLLKDTIGAYYMALMEDHYPVHIGGDCNDATVTNPITDVVWSTSFRGAALSITLQDASSCSGVNPSDITVDDGMPAAQSLLDLSLATNNGDVWKASWNWSIFSEDEGMGVHNPDLSLRALQGAIAAVSEGGVVSINSVRLPASFGVINSQ